MILHCTFEELSALGAGAQLALGREWVGADMRVAAPPEVLADVEALVPRLTGDFSFPTLADQQRVQRAVDFIVEMLHEHMTTVVVEEHAAAEGAVTAYFEWAHALAVQERLRRVGGAMAAMLEVMTGRPPTAENVERFTFPDD